MTENNLKNNQPENQIEIKKKSDILKRIILAFLLIFFIGGAWFVYRSIQENKTQRNVLQAVPQDAVYFLKTNQLTESWKEVNKTNIWRHLIKTKGFEYLQSIDTLLGEALLNNSTTKYIFDNRPTLMSAHMIGNTDYEFLYVVDLQNTKHIKQVFDYILKFNKSHKTIKLNYKKTKIYKLISKKNTNDIIFISTIDNLLISSFSFKLIKQSIDEKDTKYWQKNLQYKQINDALQNELIQFYFNYKKLSEFTKIYLKDAQNSTQSLSKQLILSGFDISHDDERIHMEGWTCPDSLSSYMTAMLDVKPGKLNAYNIISNQAALYTSIGFKNFNMFHQSLLDQYTYKDKIKRTTYRKQVKKLENFFKINLQKDFFDWIGQEIALVKLGSYEKHKPEKLIMLIQAKDIADARNGLTHIVKKIRKRSPFKEKKYQYKNLTINYLYQKSFFKIFLGDLFKDFDKPYFTYIENYVVFSNSKKDLEDFIDDYVMGKTLSHNKDYMDFRDDIDVKSNVNIYIQMPKLYRILQQNATPDLQKSLREKQNLLLSFSRINFQLIAKDDIFKTNILIDHDEQAQQKEETEVTARQVDKSIDNRFFEDLSFRVAFPDSISITNGNYKKLFNDGKTIKTEGKARNNLPEGIWRTYYPSGNLQSVVNYKNGDIDGEVYYYFDKKPEVKKVEAVYDNNLLTDTYMEYWPNGAQKAKLQYEDGKLDGKAYYYFSSGKIKIEGKYKKGVKKGKWIFYNQKGEVVDKKRYSGLFF